MGTIIVVFVSALFAPSALGSCGDYVTIVRGNARPSHPMPVPASHETPYVPVKPLPCPCRTSLPFGDLPCNGPGCEAPAAPAPMTAPVLAQRSHDAAVPESALQPAPLPFIVAPAEPGRAPLACQLPSVFRPPRS